MTQNQSAREEIADIVTRWANWIIDASQDLDVEDHAAGKRKVRDERDRIIDALRLSSGGQGRVHSVASGSSIPTALPDGLLDELERLARAATPGPWRRDENNVWGACDPDDTTSHGMGINIVECRSSVPQWAREPLDYFKSETNAAYIAAANPSVVLKLIEALRATQVGISAPAEMNPKPSNHPQQQGEKP